MLERILKSFCLTLAGVGRQERAATIPGEQLPVDNAREALHLHHADEARRRLESNPVQSLRLHEEGLRNQLHRNAQSTGAHGGPPLGFGR